MTFDTQQLIPVLPEIFLLVVASAVLVMDLFLKDEQRILSYGAAVVGLLATAAIAMLVASGERQVIFHGNVVRDGIADVTRVFICLVSAGALLYSRPYLQDRGLFKGEFYVLGLFATLGMLIMVAANGFLTLYLGLELLSLSLYALVAFDRDSGKGSEAAMKYFVLGALASGMLLYGISMIYGATGAIDFPGVSQAIASSRGKGIVLVFGLVFVVIGLAFKFGAVPFHMWAPDVYQGATTPVTLLVGSAPKIAAFVIAIRMLSDGMEGLRGDWGQMLAILAVLSMALGNLAAIAQTNVKRMLAYSTISHVGFIFLGLIGGQGEGYASAMFYAITYAVTAAAGFAILILLSRRGLEAETLDDLKGLNERSPWFAGMMLLAMFSMAGVPPLVGFFAKLFVLQAVVAVGLTSLALIAVFFSIIGAFYYLRIVKLMYFDKPVDNSPLVAGIDLQVALSFNGLSLLALGIYPTGLLNLCVAAFS